MIGTGVTLNRILIFLSSWLAVFPLDVARTIELILLLKPLGVINTGENAYFIRTALPRAAEIVNWPFTA